jgi:(2R)-ethylmalonyl-CoA mutase
MATDPERERERERERDAPWVMRTYSGHSTARASNELYRTNLAKGQTGLSIAFDLPTQTGYDPDAPEAAGEVGKVGVPVAHLGHMRELLEGIPVENMNTSMTINATAAWLLGLYVAHAQDKGVDPTLLAGTTQNDIVKEYLSRGTYIFPPGPSLRLTVDTIAYTVRNAPKWNPINVCSYHLQEAGATPVQEIAYALATAIGVLDGVRASGKIEPAELPQVVGRISFFVNSSVRFVEETCKMRAFNQLWDRICRERYGVEDPKLRRFRYGVQVNSLGLTEQQPENNVQRIVLETLGVTLSKSARARAMQLPAWNEALGLPRPWDQQWSLRMQQVLAFESDLLEYGDIFEGSVVMEAKTAELAEAASVELADVEALGGAFEAIDELKRRLVRSQAERVRRIESGAQMVVGVNCYTETAPSPLVGDGEIDNVLKVDHKVEAEQIIEVERWRTDRDGAAVHAALDELRRVADDDGPGANIMEATIALAHAGGTTGEWAGALREVFGEFRAPTGVSGGVGRRGNDLEPVRLRTKALAERTGGPPRLLVAKPGLDGHSNGAEQIAVAARDAGFEVIYQGIRLTPAQIVAAARDEDVDIVGLSILSGSHLDLVPDVLDRLRAAGSTAAVVVGGIIPPEDAELFIGKGVSSVYTPKDYSFDRIMEDLVSLAERQRAATPA